MNLGQLNIISENPLEFRIESNKPPLFIQSVLVFFAIVAFLFVIILLGSMFIGIVELHVRVLFAIIFPIGTGIYLLRKVLWNNVGAENYRVTSTGISFYADFKYFKDGQKELRFEDLTVGHLNESDLAARIVLSNNEDSVESTIPLEIKSVAEIIRKLENIT